MEHSCLPVSDFIAFLEVMKPFVVNAELVMDYVIVKFVTHTHAYVEEFGQVCHVLGFDNLTGETYRAPKGSEL